LVDLGVLATPIQFSLIHGVLGGISATARNLAHMASVVPPGSTWGVIAISRDQWALVGAAAALGGNVRVGLEDSLYISRGKLAKSNAEQVAKVKRILGELSLEVATPEEARNLLKLKGGDEVAF
jgi:uncharacterized protein (DUF849 family)